MAEKFCKIKNFVIMNITAPGFVLPKAILCVFVYFTTESKADAFELPFPMWYNLHTQKTEATPLDSTPFEICIGLEAMKMLVI